MKIVNGGSVKQEEYGKELMREIMEDLLPCFFSNTEWQKFKENGILDPSPIREFSKGELLELIASLQTIKSILEHLKEEHGQKRYKKIFERNSVKLKQLSVEFPFTYMDFVLGEELWKVAPSSSPWIN